MLLDRGQIISMRRPSPDTTAPHLNRVEIGGQRKRHGHASVVPKVPERLHAGGHGDAHADVFSIETDARPPGADEFRNELRVARPHHHGRALLDKRLEFRRDGNGGIGAWHALVLHQIGRTQRLGES